VRRKMVQEEVGCGQGVDRGGGEGCREGCGENRREQEEV
jgi:hypothetical protein